MTLKEVFQNDMTAKDKASHIWEYYRIHIIGTVIVFIFAMSLLNTWVFNPPPADALDFAVRTPWMSSEVASSLQEALNSLIVEEGVNEEVVIEHLLAGNNTDPQMVMASEAKFIGKIEVGELDIMLITKEFYTNMLEQEDDLFLDMRQLASEYNLDIPESTFVEGTALQGGDGYYALRANDIPKIKPLIEGAGEDIYLCIYVKSTKVDRAMKALEYLMKE